MNSTIGLFDVVALTVDRNVRVMDGLELLRQVKTRRPDLPVIIVTAYGDDDHRRRGPTTPALPLAVLLKKHEGPDHDVFPASSVARRGRVDTGSMEGPARN